MTARERGLAALKVWFDASGLGMDGRTFPEMVAYYDQKSPSFIAALGSAAEYTSQGKLDTAMKTIGAHGWKKVPFHGSFFDAIAGEEMKFRYEDLKAVAAQTVSDVAGAAKAGLGIYLAVAAVGLVLILSGALRGAR